MFKKLRKKFIVTTMVLLTSILLLIFVSIYIGVKKNSEYIIFSKISDTLNSIKVSPNGEVSVKGRFEQNNLIAIYDNKLSKLLYKNFTDIEESSLVDLVQQSLHKGKDRGFITYNDYQFAYAYKNSPNGVDIVFEDSSIYYKTMNRLVFIFAGVGILSLGGLFLVSVFIANKSIKPVEEAFKAQKQFIADASHELKTPLAIINTNMDLLLVNKEDIIENQRKWIDYIRYQTDRMSKLISNMLFLAKADNNEQLGIVSTFNISDIVTNQLLMFEAILYENNLELISNIEENIDFKGDKEGIIQLVGILIDNAIKNSYTDTKIKVNMYKKKQKLYFSVENRGDTIKGDDLEKIFERFYRGDSSRQREKGGYGLGLSIAKLIVDKNTGKINCISEDNNTTFYVVLNII